MKRQKKEDCDQSPGFVDPRLANHQALLIQTAYYHVTSTVGCPVTSIAGITNEFTGLSEGLPDKFGLGFSLFYLFRTHWGYENHIESGYRKIIVYLYHLQHSDTYQINNIQTSNMIINTEYMKSLLSFGNNIIQRLVFWPDLPNNESKYRNQGTDAPKHRDSSPALLSR